METLFRWIAGLLATILEKYADPQLQSKLDGFNERVKVATDREKLALIAEKESQAAYAVSLAQRAGWDDQIKSSLALEAESKQRLIESQARVKAIEDEAAAAKKKLDGLTGGDRVRVDL